jgi:hypothetical protein
MSFCMQGINKVAMLEISVRKLRHVWLMSDPNLAWVHCLFPLTSVKEVMFLLQPKWHCICLSSITFFLI